MFSLKNELITCQVMSEAGDFVTEAMRVTVVTTGAVEVVKLGGVCMIGMFIPRGKR